MHLHRYVEANKIAWAAINGESQSWVQGLGFRVQGQGFKV